MSVAKARPIASSRTATYIGRHCAEFARYLTKTVTAMSLWVTLGAFERGLTGTVKPEDHERVLLGLNKDGTSRIQRQNHAGKGQRFGTEVCISEDKSISVASIYDELIYEDELDVAALTMRVVEPRLLTRRGAGTNQWEHCKSVTGSATLHLGSRAGNVQAHLHLTFSPDCARADDSTGVVHGIYDHVGFMHDFHAAEMAARLQARGYGIEVNHHGIAIKDVPKEVIAAQSQRSRDIDAAIDQLGLKNTPAARAAAAERTRQDPTDESCAAQSARWKKEAAALGFTEEAARELRSHKPPRRLTKEGLDQLARNALRKVADERVFTAMDIERAVLRAGLGTGVRAMELLGAAARAIESCQCCQLAVDRRGTQYHTTKERLELETRTMERAETLRASHCRGASDRDVSRAIARAERGLGFKLGDDQREAVSWITTSPHGLSCVDGVAGTGKTAMLQAAREVWQGALGLRVVGCAPTGIAARNLQQEAHLPSYTVDKLLLELREFEEKRESILQRTSFRHENRAIAYMKKAIHPDKHRPPQVIVVDEASMLGPRKLTALLEKAHEHGCKVVLVGDPHQLQPVGELPGTFQAMCRRFGAAQLTKIHRQRSTWGKEQVATAREGDLKKVIAAFAEMGRIRAETSREQAIEQLARDWKAAGSASDSLVLTYTRAAAAELNKRIQKIRQERGELSGSGMKCGDQTFFRNDVVRFTESDARLGFVNGEKARVVATLGAAIALKVGNRLTILPRSRAAEMLSLGYASTTHAAQGETTERAFVLIERPVHDDSLLYVQLSRARGVTRFYVDTEGAGEEWLAVGREARERKEQALEFGRSRDAGRKAASRDSATRSTGREI